MCGRKSKTGLKRIGVMLLLLLVASLPLFSSGFVQVSEEDWAAINNYVQQQKVELPRLQNQLLLLQENLTQQKELSENLNSQLLQAKLDLTTAQTQLSDSSEILKILQQSLTNTTNELNKLERQNTWLKIGLTATVGISLGCIIYIVISTLR